MHTSSQTLLHSDASWILIVCLDLWLFLSLFFVVSAKQNLTAPDILMRGVMISVSTYGLLLSWLNDSYFDSATIMAYNKICLAQTGGRLTRWTWLSRGTLVKNRYKCLENRLSQGTRVLAEANYSGEFESLALV
ncbi:hypothetical protein AMTRI_Chr05g71530 [Amborella trichopoda]